MIQAGIVAWIIPGGGHFILGHRGLAYVFGGAIGFLFLTGLLIGGVKTSVNPLANRWLFLAEMGVGGPTIAAYVLNLSCGEVSPREVATIAEQKKLAPEVYARYVSFYPASDIAMIYLACAGLLNVLAILDAVTRAQTGGLPTYYRQLTGSSSATHRRGGGAT